jgi:nucleoid DNA-binding protein
MRLEAFLSDLLYEHDCVIIPGFGGLVATYRPARLNRITHIIKPPSKHVGFNRNLTHGDGLLASHIVRVTGITYREASDRIEETVAEYLHTINQGERVQWERIGLFFKDRSGSLQFMPEEQENFLLESYGLTSVQLRPIASEKEQLASGHEDEGLAAVHPDKPTPIWWKVAAAAALPLIAAGAWLISQQLRNNSDIQLAGLNPFKTPVRASHYVPVPARTGFAMWDTLDVSNWNELIAREGARVNLLTGEEDAMGVEIGKTRPGLVARSKPARENTGNASARFQLIAGAFEYEQNADEYIRQLSADGVEASRAGRRGRLFLVSVGAFGSEREARLVMREIKAKGKHSVWLYRR